MGTPSTTNMSCLRHCFKTHRNRAICHAPSALRLIKSPALRFIKSPVPRFTLYTPSALFHRHDEECHVVVLRPVVHPGGRSPPATCALAPQRPKPPARNPASLSRIAEQLGKPVLWLGTQAIEVFFEVRIAIFVSVAVSVLWILRIEVMGRFPGVGHAVAVRVFGGRLAFEFGPAAYLVLRIKQFARLISYRRCCCGNR